MPLFDRDARELDADAVRIRVKDPSLHRPRQWGLLAGADALGPLRPGPVLATAAAVEPAGHALAGRRVALRAATGCRVSRDHAALCVTLNSRCRRMEEMPFKPDR